MSSADPPRLFREACELGLTATFEPHRLPQVGEIVAGKYRVLSLLGSGQMGLVMAAEHLVLKHRVALKFMHEHLLDDEVAVWRFAREARAAASLRSDHTVRVLDVDQLPWGAPYIVMELLEGSSLDARLFGTDGLDVEDAVAWGIAACDALAEAHENGIVHRDIKPENLFVTKTSAGKSTLKVLDFGLAKCLDASEKTGSSRAIGSPQYMSPEQIAGATELDHRTDIWSLGATLYEVLTGRVAFAAPDIEQTFTCILHSSPMPLRQLSPEIPKELAAVVMRCLERDPDARFQSARDLGVALRNALRPSVDAPATSSAMRRHLWLAAISGPLAIAIFVLGATVASLPRGAPRAMMKAPIATTALVVRTAATTTAASPPATGTPELDTPSPPPKRFTWVKPKPKKSAAAGIVATNMYDRP